MTRATLLIAAVLAAAACLAIGVRLGRTDVPRVDRDDALLPHDPYLDQWFGW